MHKLNKHHDSLFFTLYVPSGSKKLYQTSYIWQDFINVIEFEATAVHLPELSSPPLLKIIEQLQANPDDFESITGQFSALGIQSIPDELLNAKEDQSEDIELNITSEHLSTYSVLTISLTMSSFT